MAKTVEVFTEKTSDEDAAVMRENISVKCLRSGATASAWSSLHTMIADPVAAAMRSALPGPVNGSASSPVQRGMMNMFAYLVGNPGKGFITRSDYRIKPVRFQGIVADLEKDMMGYCTKLLRFFGLSVPQPFPLR
jgi:hypothetical protein